MKKCTILIVEDEGYIRRGLERFLREHSESYTIYSAANGEEGFELACEKEPEIVYTDIRMPVLGGLELIERIRQEGLDSLVVIISGYSNFDYMRKAIQLGAFDYLLKPVKKEELTRIQEKALKQLTLEQRVKSGQEMISLDSSEQKLLQYLEDPNNPLPADHPAALWAYGLITVLQIRDTKIERQPILRLAQSCGNPQLLAGRGNLKGNYVFIFHSEIKDKELKKLEEKLIGKLHRSFEGHQSYHIGRTRPFESLSQIPDRFRESLKACRFSRIRSSRLTDFSAQAQSPAADSLESIINNFNSHQDFSDIEKAVISDISELLFRNNGDLQDLKFYCYRYLDQIESTLSLQDPIEEKYEPNQEMLVTKKEIEETDNIVAAAQFFLRFCRKAFEENQRSSVGSFRLNGILRYLLKNYRKSISLTDLANEYGISSGHLSKRFKEELGLSYIQYLTQIRLEKACELLQSGKYKIYEIGKMVGYSDTKYFIRLFREKYGSTPFQYKKELADRNNGMPYT